MMSWNWFLTNIRVQCHYWHNATLHSRSLRHVANYLKRWGKQQADGYWLWYCHLSL